MIGRREFDRTLQFLRRSDVHTDIENQLRAKPGGRPRALSVDVLLAAIMLAFQHHNTTALTAVHRLLTTELDRAYQRQLGLLPNGQPITIRQVRYTMGAITALFQHSAAVIPDLEAPERARREEALQNVIDKLLASATLHLGTTGRYAIDGTAIESAARGKRKNAAAADALDAALPADLEHGRAFDRDARWGYRTKTYDNKTSCSATR